QMSASFLVREAVVTDIDAMARLRAITWGTEEGWRERIHGYLAGTLHPRHALAPRVAFVAVRGDATIGLIAGHLTTRYGCDGELEWIDVDPTSRGTSAASALFRALASWFLARDVRRVCVD